MSDAVTTHVTSNTGIRYEVILNCISDGTGETSVKKIDLTDIEMPGKPGVHPQSLSLEKVEANVNGFTYIELEWDRDPSDITMVVLPAGHTDLCLKEKMQDPNHGQSGTGDILLTSSGADSGDSYVIRLRFKCKY
jgi:hypothetical protein